MTCGPAQLSQGLVGERVSLEPGRKGPGISSRRSGCPYLQFPRQSRLSLLHTESGSSRTAPENRGA